MPKNKLPLEEKKVKMSITISRELVNQMNELVNNKSKYIESLISKDLKK